MLSRLSPARTAIAAIALALAFSAPRAALAEEVVVFAAASMKNALDEVAAGYMKATGNTVTISYGGSNALAKQIIEGAPADIFLSAAVNWMDEVEKAGLVADGMRTNLLGNTLVLVAHGGSAAPVEIKPGLDLVKLLNGGKLSMAMVDSVPAGQYGKSALESLGIWAAVEPSVAQSENVRAALAFVSSGEAPFGIVYSTDAVADKNVSVVATFPAETHKPIVYPGALLKGAADPADKAFFEALSGDAADAIFSKQGFAILN